MGDVREFNLDANKPHKVSVVICLRCLHRFTYVRPEETDFLSEIRCPKCRMSGGVIETGQDIEIYTPSS